MNKERFLKEIENLLAKIPKNEREEILYDYKEHFNVGISEGKTEEEIISNLGSPQAIASQYVDSNLINENQKNIDNEIREYDTTRAIIIGILLIGVNLIFVLGLYIGLWGVIIGLFGAGIGIFFAGFGLLFNTLFHLPTFVTNSATIASIINSNPLITILMAIGLISLGALFLIGMFFVAKGSIKITIKYIKWNVKLARGR